MNILWAMMTIMMMATAVKAAEKSPTVASGDKKLTYKSPLIDGKSYYFGDHFDRVEESRNNWILSQAKKDDLDEEIAKYDGVWNWESPADIIFDEDKGLVLKSKAKHAAIAAPLFKEFDFKANKPLVVQYEVTMQDGQECGGSYLKLLSTGQDTADLTKFNDKTPYTIMFGPDKCGGNKKIHFIFRHVNPLNGSISEKHCKKPKERVDELFTDKLPHLYQLIVYPDSNFEMRVDHNVIKEGSLLWDFQPPVNPPADIDDPTDRMPDDWDEREKIADPLAQKPDDWDEDAPAELVDESAQMPDNWLQEEPTLISDPTAKKPDDWDAEIDGEWEAPLVENPVCETVAGCGPWRAPLIANPAYKGKWHAPMIENPNFQGFWAPRKIPNPDFFEDLKPFQTMTPISAVGLELWSMSPDILFDNLIITDDIEVAREFAAQTFDIKRRFLSADPESFVHQIVELTKNHRLVWIVVTLTILLVITVGGYLRFGKAKKTKLPIEKTTTASVAQAKKNDDEIHPDNEEEIHTENTQSTFEEETSTPIPETETSLSNIPQNFDSIPCLNLDSEAMDVAARTKERIVRKRAVRKD
ncbi:calnexin-like [Drosophila willistoni]|uniref:calnexin-like n=1 Tax=Drosophila willistoni TaxID=7260 RepID=UPI00017D9BA6|nr:calnexin-like [Drosophila willistoni]